MQPEWQLHGSRAAETCMVSRTTHSSRGCVRQTHRSAANQPACTTVFQAVNYRPFPSGTWCKQIMRRHQPSPSSHSFL